MVKNNFWSELSVIIVCNLINILTIKKLAYKTVVVFIVNHMFNARHKFNCIIIYRTHGTTQFSHLFVRTFMFDTLSTQLWHCRVCNFKTDFNKWLMQQTVDLMKILSWYFSTNVSFLGNLFDFCTIMFLLLYTLKYYMEQFINKIYVNNQGNIKVNIICYIVMCS